MIYCSLLLIQLHIPQESTSITITVILGLISDLWGLLWYFVCLWVCWVVGFFVWVWVLLFGGFFSPQTGTYILK